MQKKIFTLSFLGLALAAQSQNVGIGTSTPVASAKLEISSTNSGLLIPRVALVAVTNGTTPVASPATGVLVYNTNAAVTGGAGTGFYFWDGTTWRKLTASGAGNNDITTATTGVTITNGTGQVVGGTNVAINVASNSATSPGLVASGAGQNTKVWGTDALGNPVWVEATSIIDVQNGLNINTTAPNASAANPYVELGGTLIRNTTITQGAFNMLYDQTGVGIFRINHINTTASTTGTYPFAISRAGNTEYTIGSDGSFVYNQTWNSKPLLINGQGNFVAINKTTAPIQNLDVNGRMNVANGVIQRGTSQITGTSDLGLYSQVAGNWIRIATNAAPIKFFTDQGGTTGIGTNALVSMESANGGGVKIAAQTGGTLNAGTPDANAILDMESTNKGVLFTRMTTAQRDAIPNPSQGLTIYNTDNQCLEWWDVSLAGTNKWNSYCRYCEHQVFITASQSNLDVAAYIASQGIPLGPFNYCITINAGVTIQAATQSGNAMFFTNVPDGAKIFITNYGRVVGGGGNGGLAGAEGNTTTCSSQDNNGGNGGNGGHAMVTKGTVPLYITNAGLIAGGGGGGGGGDAGCCSAGGGGGGGAGLPAGIGGGGRCSQCASGVICTSCTGNTCSSAGNAGATPVGIANASGGVGGAFANENSPCGTGFNGNNGGNGGSLGGNGGSPADLACSGCSDCRVPGVGGTAGKAVSGGWGNQLSNTGGGLFYGSVD